MGSGWAVAVTVVGSVSIAGLLALLARYLGLWTWALAYLRAAREEKVKLCRSQRTTSTRSYLFDNDTDWIGLWPRTGSYKRFTNLDDPTSVASLDDPSRPPDPDEPDLPPQPLRPAPAPPPRMAGWTEGGDGSPSPASSVGMGIETPPEPSRPAPVLDRRDSSRSLTGRISRRDSSKELLGSSQQSSPKRASTNPFRASWVPPDETSEESVTQNTFSAITGSSPGKPVATGSQSIEGFPDPRDSRIQSDVRNQVGPEGPGSSWDTSARPREVESEGLTDRGIFCDTSSSSAKTSYDTSYLPAADSGAGKTLYDTFAFSAVASDAGKTQFDSFSTPIATTIGADKTAYDTSLTAGTSAGNASYNTFSSAISNLGKTPYSISLNNYDALSDKQNDSNEPRDDVFVDISQNDNTENVDDNKHFEKSNRTYDRVLGGTLNFTLNDFERSTQAVNDIKQGLDNTHTSGTRLPQMEATASESTCAEAQVTSDVESLSFEVPATSPITAIFSQTPRSPHITSKLAELEARMKQLGASTERDVSQDWWPSDTPSSSVVVEEVPRGGRNPFIVSVGSGGGEKEEHGGLRSVEEEEEVFLLHDTVNEASHRTDTRSERWGGVSSSVGTVSDAESEEDASARRVREYIASLSARLRQIPDQEDIARASPDYMDTPPTSATCPATPPNSAARASNTATDELPTTGTQVPHSSEQQSSTSTPPTTAALRNLYSNRRASADVSPASPTIFTLNINRRLSLDTPPSSAGLVTATPPNSASSQLMFGDTPPSSAGYSSTPPNSAGLAGSFEVGHGAGQTLKRAMSCDSVSSDTSVTLGELEDTCGQVTGHLTVQLIYDSDTADLEVVVVEGRDLVGPDPHVAVDSYVRVFLLPDKSTNMQTSCE
nr:uncharacterized protein LOC128684099 [Cherax quadricarinatus]